MENKPIRPSCFDFAMDFLGEPQAAEILKYIEALESGVQQNTSLTKTAPDLLEACSKMIDAFRYTGEPLVGVVYMAKENMVKAIAKATGE